MARNGDGTWKRYLAAGGGHLHRSAGARGQRCVGERPYNLTAGNRVGDFFPAQGWDTWKELGAGKPRRDLNL
jgi:hypothetical protein